MKLLELYYIFANKYTLSTVHKTCFCSFLLVYRKRELRCRKWQQLAINLPSFNTSLLQQFTEPRQFFNILGIVKKCTVNLQDGDRLSYTQAA